MNCALHAKAIVDGLGKNYANLQAVVKIWWWNRELTLKCKLKCFVKPMKDPLGVSPSKGNQGTTRGKEKILLTSVGIEHAFHIALKFTLQS